MEFVYNIVVLILSVFNTFEFKVGIFVIPFI